MAQAVDAHVRKVMLPAYLLDGAPQTVLGNVQDRSSGFSIPLDGRCQLRDHYRHVAGGGSVFVLSLPPGAVSSDRQRGEGVAVCFDIGVDGLFQCRRLRSCFGPLSGQVFGLDGPVLPDAGARQDSVMGMLLLPRRRGSESFIKIPQNKTFLQIRG